MVAKLEKLLKQQEQLKARIQSERAKESKRNRQLETRKKILAGSYLLHKYKDDPESLKKLLDPFLTRDRDRSVFDLPNGQPEKDGQQEKRLYPFERKSYENGYKHAIIEMVRHHMTFQDLTFSATSQLLENLSKIFAKLAVQGIAEGLEFLCLPYREDIWYKGPIPLAEDHETGILRDNKELERRSTITVELTRVAFEAMQYLLDAQDG